MIDITVHGHVDLKITNEIFILKKDVRGHAIEKKKDHYSSQIRGPMQNREKTCVLSGLAA